MMESDQVQMDDNASRDYYSLVPPEEILPVFNAQFESSIPGIFVIGDVTGVPLVKIAANQGRAVIEGIERQSVISTPTTSEHLDVLIVGGGPAGISAAMECHRRGWKYVLIERAQLASTVRNFPPGKKVYAEPRGIANDNELQYESDLEKNDFLEMITEKVESLQLHIKENTEVTTIHQQGDRQFEVETKSGKLFPCQNVVIAIGRQGNPRKLGIPGENNSNKVTYRFRSAGDYQAEKILVVGGGNSAIETALMLCEQNQVTIAYRGHEFFRAKDENAKRLDEAVRDQKIEVFFNAQVNEIEPEAVELTVDGGKVSIPNDRVIIQIGTLPPLAFLRRTGIELDGIWSRARTIGAMVGICMGILIYFAAHNFVLKSESAGEGKWYLPSLQFAAAPLEVLHDLTTYLLPIGWLLLLGLVTVNKSLSLKNRKPRIKIRQAKLILIVGAVFYLFNNISPEIFTLDPTLAGTGPYYLPGLEWMFGLIPDYFSNLIGFYYLLYFTAIVGFGIYWAIRVNHPLLWKRNLTLIAIQWTLWWGIPTFLVVFLGTNPWTPLLSRSINAWPLKMDAFEVDPSILRPGDPEWWYLVGVVAVVWAVVLTFVIIPLFTIKFGKIYCSYICSCGALAETVGHSFRHRAPKGDRPRRWEKYGFLVVVLASLTTIMSLMGWQEPVKWYNIWIGTFLAGAIAVGLYPFLGQRIWCRMWCPLAFWMNFWGKWSKFRITAEKGKCIDCNLCNQYCQMGIDIKSRALQGKAVTLADTPCVGCAECVMRCPMEILHIGDIPEKRLHQIGEEGN